MNIVLGDREVGFFLRDEGSLSDIFKSRLEETIELRHWVDNFKGRRDRCMYTDAINHRLRSDNDG